MAYLPALILLLLSSSLCRSDDQLTQAKPLHPGEILISKNGDFALGFFSPSTSNNTLYIGIWYHKIADHTPVWIANRNNPIINSSSSKLAITNSQGLVLSDSEGHTLWTTANNTQTEGVGATAELLDSGNFVLRSANGTDMWQSFDHLTNNILPSMKVKLRSNGQVATRLFAWKGPADPSTGDFSGSIDPNSNLQFFIWKLTQPYCRITFFNDVSVFDVGANTSSVLYQSFISTGGEFYFTYRVSDGSPYIRVLIEYNGDMRILSWNNSTSSWASVFGNPSATCDLYASCGTFGYCDKTEAIATCRCLDGFEPIDSLDISRGCRRKEALKCEEDNHFVTLPSMKVPDKFLHIRNRSFEECVTECSTNCSCTAYAYLNMSNAGTVAYTSRCLLWSGDLIDTGKVPIASFGHDLYLRLAVSHVQNKRNLVKILLPIIACLFLVTWTALACTCKYRGKRQQKKAQKRMMLEYFRSPDEAGDKNLEFSFISFEQIAAATDNFSDSNILGMGGFGKVYKGMLDGTKQVAIKRLSKSSGQGTEEFRNEVVLIAKLQHKNLVKLIGCGIHEDEKLLVYEYLPNKSLDCFLFDSARKPMLNWPTRSKIIQGVARGIMYLHQDSRLTIIHRDLKASNILLDKEMSPKISDFGMARIFCGDQLQANTNRVVGTYGYMSPEYAMEGIFSVKSDIYSFGVLLLEIVSGLRISSPHLIKDFPNLITYGWNLWKEGKVENMVDSSVRESCSFDEASRYVHIGLLCVQDSPNCRPLMSAVVYMLENESTRLPTPKQPVYFAQRGPESGDGSSNRELSVNGMSHTALEGR
ncbi:hypothetical protein ACP4OV_026203 [Aristida adscensionis]